MTTIDYLIVGSGRTGAVIARLLQGKTRPTIARAFMLVEKKIPISLSANE